MIKSRWFYHPLFIFIFSLLALALSLFLYIRSYLQVSEALQDVIVKYNLNSSQILQGQTWVFILVLSLLVAVILTGLLVIYIYYQKMIQLYRLQQNFINGFTHELKTPIASLQLFLETFSRHELKREDQLKYLEYMKRDTKRLSDNVSRILHLGRLEDRNFKADFHQENLIDVVANFIENVPHLFDEGKVFYETNADTFDFPIDRVLIEMVLMNLITNGFIYNKSIDKKVIVKIEKVDEQKLLIHVTDNGVGIDKTQYSKIFKKFYQVGKTAKGSGIGLYIVGQILKLHKAMIRVESPGIDQGATFTLTFKRNR